MIILTITTNTITITIVKWLLENELTESTRIKVIKRLNVITNEIILRNNKEEDRTTTLNGPIHAYTQ